MNYKKLKSTLYRSHKKLTIATNVMDPMILLPMLSKLTLFLCYRIKYQFSAWLSRYAT